MAFEEDLQAFFDEDEFAKSALWNGSTTVNVIFDNAYLEQLNMASRQPIARAIESQFTGVQEGDTLVISGVTYRIENFEADGTGELLMQLARTS
jgi:hypothetical protein